MISQETLHESVQVATTHEEADRSLAADRRRSRTW